MADKIAISEHAALRTLYNAGHNTEDKLKHAQSELHKIKQATIGYWYADDVTKLVERLK